MQRPKAAIPLTAPAEHAATFVFLKAVLATGERKWVFHSIPRPPEGSGWNAGQQVGAKRALKVRQIWAIRFFLDREVRTRDRALCDLASRGPSRDEPRCALLLHWGPPK